MSLKSTSNSHTKSSKLKKLSFSKVSTKNNELFKHKNQLSNKSETPKILYNLIFKNLKKYSTSKKKYNKYIINSIIFDHRIHIVAVFKNNLLWDESSEFLKRFYKNNESFDRIPKISEYYEKYTLFSPVYFGLEGLIVIIMNKWTKKKKNYLEYVEDHEEEKKKSKLIESFEPLINSSSLNNIASSKSLISKNTLELTKFENESKQSLMNKNKFSTSKKNKNDKDKNKDENISFSDIMNDLSSNYSVIISNDNNNNKRKTFTKNEKIIKTLSINYDKERNLKNNNAKTFNKNNNKESNNIVKKTNNKNAEYSPKKFVKISLHKNKYKLRNNNAKIYFRNNNINLPIPSAKNFGKKILTTEHIIKTNKPSKNISKGTIRVNTITSYIQENNTIGNKNNHIIQKVEKDNSVSLKKKYNFNFIRNGTNKNLILANNKQYINTINTGNILNSNDKLSKRVSKNKKNILKRKNYIQIKKEPFLNINNLSNTLNKFKQSTFRNPTSNYNINYFSEIRSIPIINKTNLTNNIPKLKNGIINPKKNNDNDNNKKLYLEDPFIYKLTQLNKKKIISLTTNNSSNRIKKFSINGVNSITGNSNSNINKSKNKCKITNKKNLVLTRINSKKNLIYNNKRKLTIEENTLRNNSANSSLLHKNSDASLNLRMSNKRINNWKNTNKKNNQKNINLNLNLNIHFNIGLENKNKGRKISFNNTIINQFQNTINKNAKFANINKSKEKEFIYQYPLTSRESKNNIK